MVEEKGPSIVQRRQQLSALQEGTQEQESDHEDEEKSMKPTDETPTAAPGCSRDSLVSQPVNESPFILVESRKQRAARRRKLLSEANPKPVKEVRVRKTFPPSILLTGHEHPSRWDDVRQEAIRQVFPTCVHAFLHEWGGIRVQFETREAAKKAVRVMSLAVLRTKLGARTRVRREGAQTKLALVGLPRNVNDGDILRSFQHSQGEAQILACRGGRHSHKKTIILTVPEQKCEMLIKAGEIQLGPFLKARVEHPHEPKRRQCFFCQSWQHLSRTCPEKKPTCRKCSGRHESRMCTSNRKRCANCGKQHFASSIECEHNPNKRLHERLMKERKQLAQAVRTSQASKPTKVPSVRSAKHTTQCSSVGQACSGSKRQWRPKRLQEKSSQAHNLNRCEEPHRKPTSAAVQRRWQPKRHQKKATQTETSCGTHRCADETVFSLVTRDLADRKQEPALHFMREALYQSGIVWAAEIVTHELTQLAAEEAAAGKRHEDADAERQIVAEEAAACKRHEDAGTERQLTVEEAAARKRHDDANAERHLAAEEAAARKHHEDDEAERQLAAEEAAARKRHEDADAERQLTAEEAAARKRHEDADAERQLAAEDATATEAASHKVPKTSLVQTPRRSSRRRRKPYFFTPSKFNAMVPVRGKVNFDAGRRSNPSPVQPTVRRSARRLGNSSYMASCLGYKTPQKHRKIQKGKVVFRFAKRRAKGKRQGSEHVAIEKPPKRLKKHNMRPSVSEEAAAKAELPPNVLTNASSQH